MKSYNHETAKCLINDLTEINTKIQIKHSESINSVLSGLDFKPINLVGFSEILDDMIKSKDFRKFDFINLNNLIIDGYSDIKTLLNQKNIETGLLFNPLSFFKIDESMHSYLLCFLLNPYAEHGYEKLFLKEFLKELEIEVNEDDHWVVTAEVGRIDILLKRKSPKTTVIIENKSNYAVDQENQLYRYWHQEIYYPNRYRNDVLEITKNSNNFQIIYLTPADWKLPSNNSLEKPEWLTDENLPDKLLFEPKIFLFSEHIVNWLTNCLTFVSPTNHRLREFVKQYIELWS
jgi:hypothetical protein